MKIDRIKISIEKRYKILVCLFFLVYLGIGLGIFRDYGLAWDEPYSRMNGVTTLNYVIKGDQALFAYYDRYHGPVFEVVLVGLERILKIRETPRALYFMRHLVTFLLFYTGAFFFYRLCKYRFRSWKIGLLGSLFLILSPRIFAHSFYNPKDIPFLAMFIISMYTLVRYLEKKTLPKAVLHAVTCAFLIDMRILGIIVPLFTAVFLAADLLIIKALRIKWKKIIAGFLIYAVLLMFFIVLFWPVLWRNPPHRFLEALKYMSHYRPFIGTVLYQGNYLKAASLPWHYIPVWIIISTPVVYSFCFFIGCFVLIKRLLKSPGQFDVTKRDDIMFLLWFFLPLAAVIVLRSVLYDAWRQMFFIYPAFLMFSLSGVTSLFKSIKTKFPKPGWMIINGIFILLLAFNLVATVQFMVKYHPYQNVYFNILAGRNMEGVKKKYELDYWGLSYRKALEYVVKNDPDQAIRVLAATYPGRLNAVILPPDDRKRLVYVEDPNEAEYFISNYRGHREEYPYGDEYYSIKIGGAKIMVVYRL